MRSTSDRTALGAALLIASTLINKLLDMALLVVLARLLSPADFGLVAAAMAPVLIAQTIMEVPIGSAVLRLPQIDAAHLDTAFTLGLIRGAVVMGAVMLLAWPYSLYVNDARLFPVLMALSLSPAFRAMTSPGLIAMARDLQYGRNATVDVIAKVLGAGCGLLHALWMPSYWTLVTATTVMSGGLFVMSYVLAPYRPRVTLSRWRDLATVTTWGFVIQTLNAINWQFDRLLLGRLVSKDTLGQFSVASDVSQIPQQALVIPVTRPILPALGRLHYEGRSLAEPYARANAAVVAAVGPVLVILSVFADQLLPLLVGQQWASAAGNLRLLALAALPALFVAGFTALVTLYNRSRLQAVYCVVDSMVRLPLVFWFCWALGAQGAVWARLITSVLSALITAEFTKRLSGITWKQQFAPCMRASACLLFAYGFGTMMLHGLVQSALTQGWPLLLKALLGAGTTFAIYIFALFTSWHLSGRPEGIETKIFAVIRKRYPKVVPG